MEAIVMRVVRGNIEQWEALRPEWNALAGGVPFRYHQWLLTWWRHYGQGEPLVLEVRGEGGKLVGIAPWHVDAARIVRALGTGEVCSDYLSILCLPGYEAQVAAGLAEYLSTHEEELGWNSLNLDGVDQADEIIPLLVEELGRRQHAVHRREGHRCWRLPLPDNWEAFLEGQSKSHRRQLRRLQSRVLEGDRAKLHVVDSPASFEQGWEVLVDLHQRRRISLGEPGCFASPRFAAFHREVASKFLEAGRLNLCWLDLDGQPIATEYQLVGDTVTYLYQAGVDPDRLEEEPGRLIMILLMQQAIAQGYCGFDYLRGDEPYKAHWRAKPRQTCQYRIAARKTAARFRHQLWLAAHSVRGWWKQSTLSAPEPQA